MIYLYDFLECMQELPYCIVKFQSIDKYTEGGDMDIFCFNISEVVQVLSKVAAEKLISERYDIDIYECGNEKHVQFDVIKNKKLIFKFDLYGEMPHYKKINVKKSLFDVVIENAEKSCYVNERGKKICVKHAYIFDELLLRYIEYIEWYELRPDKVKHLEYILEKVNSDESNIDFLDRLYYYTGLPEIEIKDNKRKRNSRLKNIKDTLYKIKQADMKSMVLFLKSKMEEWKKSR